ncbi:hypothetical protein E2C01_066776 [Portunus trituberculatus]|uniref:Uncharacterized protein n=1 Tax=Portunus trituberculatus TaxID=210409 RepID=A0A5B7HUR8_PORTR|nr:hypothetical protein [Portunus trituberculatus]
MKSALSHPDFPHIEASASCSAHLARPLLIAMPVVAMRGTGANFTATPHGMLYGALVVKGSG